MRRLTSTVVAAACGALLAGCGGNPEAGPAPTPSPTSPTPSPTASAAPEPPALTASPVASPEGAAQFVSHYVELLNYLQRTGEAAPTRAVESASCASCSSVRRDVTSLYSAGGSIRGGAWEVVDVLDATEARDGQFVVSLVVKFGPQQVQRKASSQPEELKGGTLPLTVTLSRAQSDWRVENWTRGR